MQHFASQLRRSICRCRSWDSQMKISQRYQIHKHNRLSQRSSPSSFPSSSSPLLSLILPSNCRFRFLFKLQICSLKRCLESLSSSEGGACPQQLAETEATPTGRQRLWGRISSSQPAPPSMKSPQVEAGTQLEESTSERRLPSVPEAVKTLKRPWFRRGFEPTTSHGEQKRYCNHIQTARHHCCHSSSDAKAVPPVNNGCFKVGRISVTY